MAEELEEVAPPEVHHYNEIGDVPWDIQKYVSYRCSIVQTHIDSNYSYWKQRHRIFTKYEEGVWLTDDAWFGVTPESIAKYVPIPIIISLSTNSLGSKIAEHISTSAPKDKVVLIDAFAGAGGNSIAFAKSGRWKRVYAIEKNPAVLACAKHNAKIYGVDTKITWFEGDCFEILKTHLKDLGPFSVVFASPPWGGMLLPSFLLSWWEC